MLPLNDKQMPHEILFSLLDEIQNAIKMNTQKEIWNKGKRIRARCFNIYIVVFPILSSTLEEDAW